MPAGLDAAKLPKELIGAANRPIIAFSEIIEEEEDPWFLGVLCTSEAMLPRYVKQANVHIHNGVAEDSDKAKLSWLNELAVKTELLCEDEDFAGRNQAQYIDTTPGIINESLLADDLSDPSPDDMRDFLTYVMEHYHELTRIFDDCVIPNLEKIYNINMVAPIGSKRTPKEV